MNSNNATKKESKQAPKRKKAATRIATAVSSSPSRFPAGVVLAGAVSDVQSSARGVNIDLPANIPGFIPNKYLCGDTSYERGMRRKFLQSQPGKLLQMVTVNAGEIPASGDKETATTGGSMTILLSEKPFCQTNGASKPQIGIKIPGHFGRRVIQATSSA